MEVAQRNVHVSSQTCRSKQKKTRCHALEPVLEHYELFPSEKIPCPNFACNDAAQAAKKGKPMRILSKLRDKYVKLMNEMASGADFSGVSSFYGCPGADYSVFTMANAKLRQEEQEKEVMSQALQLQMAHSRHLTCTFA